MIKVSMLATLLAGLAMGSSVAFDSRPQQPAEARDAKIIIELDRSLDSLTKQGVKNVQNIMYNRIKRVSPLILIWLVPIVFSITHSPFLLTANMLKASKLFQA